MNPRHQFQLTDSVGMLIVVAFTSKSVWLKLASNMLLQRWMGVQISKRWRGGEIVKFQGALKMTLFREIRQFGGQSPSLQGVKPPLYPKGLARHLDASQKN